MKKWKYDTFERRSERANDYDYFLTSSKYPRSENESRDQAVKHNTFACTLACYVIFLPAGLSLIASTAAVIPFPFRGHATLE